MPDIAFPRMLTVRQKFPPSKPVDIRAALEKEFAAILPRIKPGARIAIAVGSRGISHLKEIVTATVDLLKRSGAQPFILPAMGSHGGATPQGQAGMLEEYGVTESTMGVPIRAAMEVERVGMSEAGVDVVCSVEAMRADGIVLINRVKPHTDFQSDTLGSGILKMLVIGLGKREGASNFHRAASRLGFEKVIRSSAKVVLRSAPVLGAVAIVEDQFHETARVAVIPAEKTEEQEAVLFAESKRLMPRLPLDEMDLLIVDRLGKNISGSGMDPNIIGRGIHGYSSSLAEAGKARPIIRRLFVRDLTPESHGNAIGIGMADFTTSRLARAMDPRATFINTLTSMSLQAAKLPMHFDTDREVIAHALGTLALDDVRKARIVRIRDTLSLDLVEVSETCGETVKRTESLEALSEPEEMQFDEAGNLLPLK